MLTTNLIFSATVLEDCFSMCFITARIQPISQLEYIKQMCFVWVIMTHQVCARANWGKSTHSVPDKHALESILIGAGTTGHGLYSCHPTGGNLMMKKVSFTALHTTINSKPLPANVKKECTYLWYMQRMLSRLEENHTELFYNCWTQAVLQVKGCSCLIIGADPDNM